MWEDELRRRYFIWDTIDSMLNSTIGFVVHGTYILYGNEWIADEKAPAAWLSTCSPSYVCFTIGTMELTR
jgi:hypothetical protein